APDDRAKVFVQRPAKAKDFMSQAVLLLSLGLRAGETKDKATRERLDKAVTTLMTDQTAEGSWRLDGGRPPIVAGPGVLTTLTLLALPPRDGEKGKETMTAREKALKWLANVRPEDDLQAVTLRVVLRQRLGESKKELQGLAQEIVRRQNKDGGWSQTKE